MKAIIKQYRHLTLAALLAGALISCKKDFLEITPKGKLIAQTVSDYNLLLNSNDFLNCGSANAQVYMGDEMAAAEPYFSAADLRTQRLFKWSDTIYEPNEIAGELESTMQNIYAYNKIINEVMNAKDGSEQQKKSIRAEALAGRAWTYFLLINYYGKPYNAATSNKDPGFPIITVADVTATKFTRASVKEVYDFIVNDITTALPNLPAATTHRLRMSRGAAEGLLGKVYMYMGNFSDALTQLDAALEDLKTATVPIALYDYNLALGPGGEFLPIDIFGPSTPVTLLDKECIYAKQFSNFWVISSELVINPHTAALFNPSDLRLNFYSTMPFPAGPVYQSGLLRRMGPLTTPFGVVLPDLYLLRAECKARANDLAGAVTDVETLRRNRMPSSDAVVPPAIASQQQPLLEFVLDERVREFASQGARWFDMRRLSVDPLFPSGVYKHNVYEESGDTVSFTLKPERLVLRIPRKVLDENPGMPDNP